MIKCWEHIFEWGGNEVLRAIENTPTGGGKGNLTAPASAVG